MDKNNNEISPEDSDSNFDDKDLVKKPPIPYPKSVIFIIGNEFCERFSFYGMRSNFNFFFHDLKIQYFKILCFI